MSSTARSLTMVAAFALAAATGLSGCSDAPTPPAPSALGSDVADTSASQDAEQTKPAMRPAQTRNREPEGNRPPKIRSLSLQPVEGDETTWMAVVEADDAEGDEIEFDYVWFVNDEPTMTKGERFDASGQGRGDRFHVEVTPRDRHGTGSVAATGRVEVANAAPSITSQPPAKMAGGVYRYMVEARDPEGDAPLRYELLQSPDGMRIDPYSGELQWRPAGNQAGTHTIEIAVSDNRGGRSTQLFDLPITSPGA